MLKKSITIGALVVAGAILANAETFVSTNGPKGKEDGGNYYGFAADLSSTVVSTDKALPTSGDWFLQNVTIDCRDSGTSDNLKLAVYSYTQDSTTGNFLGLSSSSASFTTSGTYSFDFGNLKLSDSGANATYQFLFVAENTVADTLSSGGFDAYKNVAKTGSLKVWESTLDLPQGSGTYKAKELNSWEGKYLPSFSITTTDTIPEPSMFGVLAGLGALALVGARRRRRSGK